MVQGPGSTFCSMFLVSNMKRGPWTMELRIS
jgi:hypothetical protein